jgi:phosphoribosylformylglycinamidine cyclo-ligase
VAEDKDLYKWAGVNIDAGNETVERIKPHVARTMRKEVLSSLGGFGGGFAFPVDKYKEPVLVSGTDGVGTKLKLAFALGRHDTIGIDAVAMCVNDILAMGAEPLFFLDYFATGKLEPGVAEEVIKGIAEGCVQAGAALIGGETAEMPGMYADGEYDIAGFAVGAVERERMVDGSNVQVGDVVIGLSSSGVHSNGFSLVRKLLDEAGIDFSATPDLLQGMTAGEALLAPTRIYVKAVSNVLARYAVHAMAHITGGGLLDNIPRVLPAGTEVQLDVRRWDVPPVFTWLRTLREIDETTLYRTWNMGIGYVLIVAREDANHVVEELRLQGEKAAVIGEVMDGNRGVILHGGNE